MLKTVVLPNILVGTVIQKSFMEKKEQHLFKMSLLIKPLLNKKNCTDLLNGSCVPKVVHFLVLFNFSMD